jgi:hypothetical protein
MYYEKDYKHEGTLAIWFTGYAIIHTGHAITSTWSAVLSVGVSSSLQSVILYPGVSSH